MKQTREEFRQCIDELRQEFEQTSKISYLISNFIGHIAENYSTKFPFILEFIQNAVDSVPKGQKVKVRFCLRQESDQYLLTIANNGSPFSVTDIERLCGITKERKGPDKIGYKGIGFKSIAHITDHPQIYSNDCQFEFNRSYHPAPENFWLVVPHWIETPQIPAFIDAPSDWVTFALPLRDDVNIEELTQELNRLADEKASPALLLFLENLEELEVVNLLNDESLRIYKQSDDHEALVSSIKAIKGGKERTLGSWIVTHYPLSLSSKPIPPEALLEYENKRGLKKRDGDGKNTAISLAFRIERAGETVRFVKKDGAICAFFPVGAGENSSGLRFTVHADFLTTLNREALLPNSPWNAWLIANIPDAVMESLDLFKRNPEWHAMIYDVLPLENEGKVLFSEVTMEVIQRLRNSDIILTDEDRRWIKPAEAYWTDDALLRGLLKADDCVKLGLKKTFASPRILSAQADHERHERLKRVLWEKRGLHVEKFDKKNVFDLVCHDRWLQSKQGDPAWFEALFEYLLNSQLSEPEIARMRSVSLIPTQDGRLLQPKEVFLPTEPFISLPEVRYVHSALAANQEIMNFLRHRLRMQDGTAENVIKTVLLPAFQSMEKGQIVEDGNHRAFAYVEFLKNTHEQLRQPLDPQFVQQLRGAVKLQAKNSAWFPLADLYLPRHEHDAAPDDAGKFPALLFEKADPASWRAFYHWLGLPEPSEKNALIASFTEAMLREKQGDVAWFETLFNDLLNSSLSDADIATLRQLPIIPTQDGKLLPPKGVFLPTEPPITLPNVHNAHEKLMANPARVRFFQQRLNMPRGTAENVIRFALIPAFQKTEKGRISDGDSRVLSEYVGFVKAWYERQTSQRQAIEPQLFHELRRHIKLQAQHDEWLPLAELYLPRNESEVMKDRAGKIPVQLFQKSDKDSWRAFYHWLGLVAPNLVKIAQNLGQRGEKAAFDYLKRAFRQRYPQQQLKEEPNGKFVIEGGNQIVVEAHWLNAAASQGETQKESGESYDIQLIEHDVTHYYEVKATEQRQERDSFDLTEAEWKLAQKQGETYHILRVYLREEHAESKQNAEIVVIDDPAALLKEGNLTVRIPNGSSQTVEFFASRPAIRQK